MGALELIDESSQGRFLSDANKSAPRLLARQRMGLNCTAARGLYRHQSPTVPGLVLGGQGRAKLDRVVGPAYASAALTSAY
jgi:hypothetical protein